jgi:hypothetical protein
MTYIVKYQVHAGMLLLAFTGSLMAAAQESTRLPSALQFRDEAIAKAVRETLAESKETDKETRREGTTSAAMETKALRGDKYEEFGRQFSDAQRPGCLRPDALKHEQTAIVTKNWVFNVGGIFILPLWAKAIVTGKCN